MRLKTYKSWIYLLQKPTIDKDQLNELILDAQLDPYWKRIIAGLLWIFLSILFISLFIFIIVTCFDSIFGPSNEPGTIKWLSFEHGIIVPTFFFLTTLFFIFFAFSIAMVFWVYCMRKTCFVRDSVIELVGRKAMFIFKIKKS